MFEVTLSFLIIEFLLAILVGVILGVTISRPHLR